MRRRDWLIAAGAAGAARAAGGEIRVGAIGLGNRGSHITKHVAVYTPAKVTALCDVVPERMEAARVAMGLDKPMMTTDYQKILSSDVDAVLIATPVFLHAEHFEAAVASGKHIYIEKPAAASVADCKRIMRAADSAKPGVNITFGFQRRYGQVYLKAKALADSGAIGKIRFGSARFIKAGGISRLGPRQPKPVTPEEKNAVWGSWQDLSGDLIVENNIHSIDVLNWFLGGRPERAIGAGGTIAQNRGDIRDHNFVAYTYPGGLQGQLSGTTLGPPGYRDVVEQFLGEKGAIETNENYWKHFRGPKDEVVERSPRSIAIDSMAAFVERIRTGKTENTGVRGVESTLTAILGRLAMEKRREVTWEEMMREDDSR